MLKEALEDVKKGRVKKFENVEELIDDLHKKMQLIQATHFKRGYMKLPPAIQKRTDEKLKFLVQNVSYSSLRVKRVQKYKGC